MQTKRQTGGSGRWRCNVVSGPRAAWSKPQLCFSRRTPAQINKAGVGAGQVSLPHPPTCEKLRQPCRSLLEALVLVVLLIVLERPSHRVGLRLRPGALYLDPGQGVQGVPLLKVVEMAVKRDPPLGKWTWAWKKLATVEMVCPIELRRSTGGCSDEAAPSVDADAVPTCPKPSPAAARPWPLPSASRP